MDVSWGAVGRIKDEGLIGHVGEWINVERTYSSSSERLSSAPYPVITRHAIVKIRCDQILWMI